MLRVVAERSSVRPPREDIHRIPYIANYSPSGDGSRPICRNCIKGKRACHGGDEGIRFIIHTPDPDSLNIAHANESSRKLQRNQQQLINSSVEARVPNLDADVYQIDSFEMLVSSDPRSALNNLAIATVFRHYIDYLAPWYDLCDAENSFRTIVPLHALENPTLFKALIAFSALHKTGVSGEMQGLGQVFHAACIRDLLHAIENFQIRLRGDYLAATCLLRSYEILAGIIQAFLLYRNANRTQVIRGNSRNIFWELICFVRGIR